MPDFLMEKVPYVKLNGGVEGESFAYSLQEGTPDAAL